MVTDQFDFYSERIQIYQSKSLDEGIGIFDYHFPYRIINVVALAMFKFADDYVLDFDQLNSEVEIKRLNRFPSVMFKLDYISCIMFKNGKIVMTGIKDPSVVPTLKIELRSILHKMGIPIEGDINIEIQNLVGMTQLNRVINLELSCLTLTNCIYESEQFPAAIVKNPNGKGAFLIFSNSKIIILGMKDTKSLENALLEMIKQIHDHDLFVDISDFDVETFDDLDF